MSMALGLLRRLLTGMEDDRVTAQRCSVYMRVDEGRASLNTLCIDFELRTS
jgi:hypothetical protein